MAFHPDKCTKLTVAQNKPIQHNYILHNHILESETSAKYLGITLQSNLKRNLHYDKSLGFLKRNLTVLNTDIKSRAYQALVKPKLEYGCSAWDPHTNEYKKKIKMMQRRAARHTMNNYRNISSVNTMIDTLGWPTLAERRVKTRLIMFYKITHCLIAIPTDIFVPLDNRLRKHHSQSYQHIQTSKNIYKWLFFPHTIIQSNIQFNQPQ
jgi:hypothetical protein